MDFAELLLIAVGLSMDAFAVSVCKGLATRQVRPRHAVLAGLYFGGFQFLMPVIGYLLGVRFEALIVSIDHWIAFVLLAAIGVGMIREATKKADELNDDYGFKTMLLLAVATSIDALAVGVTTFTLSALGIWIGHVFGARYKAKAERLGGVILILIGLKILLEHLGVL